MAAARRVLLCRLQKKVAVTGISWIKIDLHTFDDEKIKLIEQMPDGDTFLLLWVRVLVLAGKTNAAGYIHLTESTPYTNEMLAVVLNHPLPTVQRAIELFLDFGMLSLQQNGSLYVTNWTKYQNVDGMERVRALNRDRQARHRENVRVTQPDNVTVTLHNAVEGEVDRELDMERGNPPTPLKPAAGTGQTWRQLAILFRKCFPSRYEGKAETTEQRMIDQYHGEKTPLEVEARIYEHVKAKTKELSPGELFTVEPGGSNGQRRSGQPAKPVSEYEAHFLKQKAARAAAGDVRDVPRDDGV